MSSIWLEHSDTLCPDVHYLRVLLTDVILGLLLQTKTSVQTTMADVPTSVLILKDPTIAHALQAMC